MSTLTNALAVYFITALLFLMEKPDFMFNKDGTIKSFGFLENETLFTYPVVCTVIGMITYAIMIITPRLSLVQKK